MAQKGKGPALQKNRIFEGAVTGYTSEGAGVARAEGVPVFLPGAAQGDRLRFRVVKGLSAYAFGRVEEILSPSPARIPVDCAVYRPCGGCQLRHIRYADELIDAHLRGRYILPLAEIPTVLRDIAITLVRYRLYARRPEGDLPDTVKDDHKEALRQLRELRDNRLTLGLPSTQKDVPEPGEFRVRSRPATFGGRDGLLEKY